MLQMSIILDAFSSQTILVLTNPMPNMNSPKPLLFIFRVGTVKTDA